MQHSDPDVLALVALGEAPATADAEHLRGCRQCRDEVAAFARVVQGVRLDPDVEQGPPVAPPPRVWDAIAAGTGVTAAPRPDRVVGEAAASAPRSLGLVHDRGDQLPRSRRRDGRVGAGRSHAGGGRERNRLLMAVAASLVVGAAAGATGSTVLGRDDPPPQQVLAQVDLANLKKTAATGRAVVVETSAGRKIRVDTSQLAPAEGAFYEVWLIDRQVKKMVGIGILAPGEDEFAVPNGVDLSQYPIVDISVQQPGDPRHSGNSILRGTIAG